MPVDESPCADLQGEARGEHCEDRSRHLGTATVQNLPWRSRVFPGQGFPTQPAIASCQHLTNPKFYIQSTTEALGTTLLHWCHVTVWIIVPPNSSSILLWQLGDQRWSHGLWLTSAFLAVTPKVSQGHAYGHEVQRHPFGLDPVGVHAQWLATLGVY